MVFILVYNELNCSNKNREKLYHNNQVKKLEKIINMDEFNYKYIDQCNNPQSTIKEQTNYLITVDMILVKKKYKINNNLDFINKYIILSKNNLSYNIECLIKKMNIN
jgi:hypothetical protein